MTTLRLVLGDQLNPNHSWFDNVSDDIVYVLLEMRQETDYVLHHAQKILAIFAAMRAFAEYLRKAGHRVHYGMIDAADAAFPLPQQLHSLSQHYNAAAFEYQEPDEWRLDQQLAEYLRSSGLTGRMVGSEHFLSARGDVADFFSGKRRWLMEYFYRHMRVQHAILLEVDGKPSGGKWNFDQENRKSWSGVPQEPEDWRVAHDHGALWQSIVNSGVKSFGSDHAEHFSWPLNREEALSALACFVTSALPHFGDYQDAMNSKSWRLFHALMSFALNTKMLHPQDAITKAEQAWRQGRVSLAACEGFIRQVLGWREYVRGVYWAHMPGYTQKNALGQTQALPRWFWDGNTRMRCLAMSIGQSLDQAYAHHIQRLMIIGNFALLANIDPAEVHAWYLGVYIDAFEWVEAPNTIGMSQFADGGLLATKPYISSAAYIDRMSDYCNGCYYRKKERIGERACPFNAMYWDFLARNAEMLSGNVRLAMPYRQLAKMERSSLAELQSQAQEHRSRIDEL